MLGVMPWSSRLRKPIALADGRTLRKLRDVAQFLLSLPEKDQRHPKWQRLTDLLMTAERSGSDALIAVLTGNIEEALKRPPFTTARLAGDDDIPKKPAAPSVRRRMQRRRIQRLS